MNELMEKLTKVHARYQEVCRLLNQLNGVDRLEVIGEWDHESWLPRVEPEKIRGFLEFQLSQERVHLMAEFEEIMKDR